MCWLTGALSDQLQRLKSAGMDRFTARAEVHAFYVKPLALAYGEVQHIESLLQYKTLNIMYVKQLKSLCIIIFSEYCAILFLGKTEDTRTSS